MEYIAEELRPLAVPVTELHPDPKNARGHDDRSIAVVKNSLQRFGCRTPICTRTNDDGQRIVIAGNARLKAAIELGWTHMPCVSADGDDASESILYALTDNRSAELSHWEESNLAEVLAHLDCDFGITDDELNDLGWSDKELDDLLDIDIETGDAEEEPEPPAVDPPKDPITKPGDLIKLGNHRLLCGDSSSIADIDRLLDGETAEAVVTDPPYGIDFDYNTHDDNRDQWYELMDKVVPIMIDKSDFVIMPCCGIDRMGWWYANHNPEWLVCWYKGSPGHRSAIGFNDWEVMLTWGRPWKAMHDHFQTECGFSDSKDHPCPKPLAWGRWLVKRAAKRNGIILDPFLGSGTTLLAAENLNRRCFGMEIDPSYCDVIVSRWENMTGETAVRPSRS